MCIATGGWRDAALLKLGLAGISIEGIPVASSDDSDERLSIMLQACERARVQKNRPAFDLVTYVADHVGDLVNSRRLGYSFVGIGSGEHALVLRRAGAADVLPDFADKDHFFKILGITKGGQ